MPTPGHPYSEPTFKHTMLQRARSYSLTDSSNCHTLLCVTLYIAAQHLRSQKHLDESSLGLGTRAVLRVNILRAAKAMHGHMKGKQACNALGTGYFHNASKDSHLLMPRPSICAIRISLCNGVCLKGHLSECRSSGMSDKAC